MLQQRPFLLHKASTTLSLFPISVHSYISSPQETHNKQHQHLLEFQQIKPQLTNTIHQETIQDGHLMDGVELVESKSSITRRCRPRSRAAAAPGGTGRHQSGKDQAS